MLPAKAAKGSGFAKCTTKIWLCSRLACGGLETAKEFDSGIEFVDGYFWREVVLF